MAAYEEVVNLALRRSLFYPASEIYASAPAGMYDYGPYGAAIRRKIAEVWRKQFVQKENFLEIDGALIMPEDVFKASGHLANFNDPMTQCAKCKTVHRADKLLEENTKGQYKEAMPVQELTEAIRKNKLKCPKCKGELSEVKQFNMMVKAEVGVGFKSSCYLRPESCQAIFTNWDRMAKTMRVKLPKGVSQIGKVFRNEISPRQTLIRQVEFNQAESEIFFDPQEVNQAEKWSEIRTYKLRIQKAGRTETEDITAEKLAEQKLVSGKLIAYYLARTQQLFEQFGIPTQKMRFRQLDDTERAFYAKEAYDFEVETSLGWMELAANNYRTDYDLTGHANTSKKDLTLTREDKTKFIPHIWEVSIGFDRLFYAILESSLKIEKERTYLSIPVKISPFHAGIFPLLSNKEELTKKAQEVYEKLNEDFEVMYDESGSIGKRYARLDEIGVPYCITIDFDSLEKNDVTIRSRDTTKQERVPIQNLPETLRNLIKGIKTL